MQVVAQWFVDCVISVLALSGYVTYYNQLLNSAAKHRQLRLDFMILAVAAGLQLAVWIDPMRFKVYANLQLLVLAFPLLGTDIDFWHLALRFAGLLGFTALNHPGLPGWAYALAIVLQCGLLAVLQRYYETLREHFWPNTLVMGLLALGYWLPRTDLSVSARVGLMGTYLVISSINFWYWLNLRHADHRYSRLAHQVDFDPLTNAASFTLFKQDAQHQFSRAQNGHEPLSVLLVDIDYFKRINDHYGHPVGDAVLIAGLRRMEQVLAGHTARIYRTGGEEFTVLLPMGQPAAIQLATKLRQAMRATPLVATPTTIDVTISAGLDSIEATDADFDTLYSRVDEDLYRSKARGRDTVTVAGKTLWRHDRLTVSHFFAEYTQPVLAPGSDQPVAVVLAARYWQEAAQAWVPADRDTIALHESLTFLQQGASDLGVANMVLVIGVARFASAPTVQAVTPLGKHLCVVVSGVPTPSQWQQFAPQYHEAGCLLVTPANMAGSDGLLVDASQPLPATDQPLYAMHVDCDEAKARVQAAHCVAAWGEAYAAPTLPQVVARTNRDQEA